VSSDVKNLLCKHINYSSASITMTSSSPSVEAAASGLALETGTGGASPCPIRSTCIPGKQYLFFAGYGALPIHLYHDTIVFV
jgi:hypothetical protein